MFLKNFMRMRQNLHKQDDALVSKMSKTKISNEPAPSDGISLSTIIEEKPKDKVVIEYFKRMCDKLNQSQ